MKTKGRGSVAIGLMVLALIQPAVLSATIPAFARKYRVSCNLCHNPAPRLTAFGEQFAANGFQFTVDEEPRDTIDTGDPLLRLLNRIDFAVRMDAFVSFSEPYGSDSGRLDLQTPYGIKLLTGGALAEKISYYMYFFLSERGQVAGLEDAYIQFSDIASSGISVVAGQFQISDPMFKRELRLPYEDYQIYRVRVGDARADLTYDRGFFASYEPWSGSGLSLMLVNGQGIGAAASDRLYDRDPFKTVAGHFTQDVGPLRVGAFGYWGRESADGQRDRIYVYGPDATLTLGRRTELNAQYLRREDTNPLLTPGGPSTVVNSVLTELVLGPFGPEGRWYLTGLYNWVDADQPVLSLRLGEQSVGSGFIERYQTVTASAHYLLQRNVRILAEAGWDIERETPRFAIGSTLAW